MAALSAKLRSAADGGILFWCPGCDGAHQVRVGEGSGPRWGYNDDPERPTFTPSVLVSGYMNGREICCHSFVTDGQIQFLSDCSHALAGRTVALPDFDEPEGWEEP